ncbi:MAG: ABC transporter permease, partial [Gammaproteobacteria bacterium]
MKALKLGLAQLRRDWRAGELRLVAAALLLAVGSVSTVAFFVDRVRNAMERQASGLLAADIAIESSYPVAPEIEQRALALGLATAHTLGFRSVVMKRERMQLVEVKAVDDSYPLRGALEATDTPFGAAFKVRAGPRPGTLWADSQLMQFLDLERGDELELGALRLTTDRVLVIEPDRGGQLFQIAPRLLINLCDIPASGLVTPGSRVTYRLLVAGEPPRVAELRAWVEQTAGGKVRIIGIKDARRELRSAFERAEQFLALAALISVILAGLAIASSARRFTQRHLDNAAMMRCLGASQGLILGVFLCELAAVGLAVSLFGASLGLLGQHALGLLLADLIPRDLPPPSLQPLVTGTLAGITALLGFALPPLIALKRVPPSRVLRHERDTAPRSSGLMYISAVLAIVLLAPWGVGEKRVTLYVLAGTAATLAVLTGAAWLMVKALGRLRERVGVAWRFGLANIARRSRDSVLQVATIGLGIMVMLLLHIVKDDLMRDWRGSLAPQAPNHFIVNIQPQETTAFKDYLRQHRLNAVRLYPMVRGRLIRINARAVRAERYRDPETRRLAERDFNLSWAEQPKPDNRIVEGRWWGPRRTAGQFSVEQGIAESLGIRLGDRLTFQIAERSVSGEVTSLRSVDWESFTVNFFVVSPPELLAGSAPTYITSFFIGDREKSLLAPLVRRFPSITVVDVAALMDNVRTIMDRAVLAVEMVSLFTLAAGVLVLIASIHASRDARRTEGALLRALGAKQVTIVKGNAAEFLCLGLLAGLLAALGAIAVGFVLAHSVFDVDYGLSPALIPLGIALGGAGVVIVGVWGTAGALRHPPIEVLRRP